MSGADHQKAWPRDEFARAVWRASTLKPLEKLVALAYADHARDQGHVFVTLPRLCEVTRLSRDAAVRARKSLVEKDWLVEKESAAQHRAARYWLRVPSSPGDVPLDDARGTRDDARGTRDDARGTRDRPDYSSDYSEDLSSSAREHDQGEVSPRHREAVAHLLAQHGAALSEDEALAAVAAIDAKHQPKFSLTAYASKFDLERLQVYAADGAGSPRVAADKCTHGRVGGMRVHGRGPDASRICHECEHESPAGAVAAERSAS